MQESFDIHSALKNYKKQVSIGEKFVSLLTETVKPADRNQYDPGHFTASAILLNQKRDKVLLTHHKKLDKWLQLGGHADGDLNLMNVALKEAQEESGIEKLLFLQDTIFDLDIHEIPPYKEIPAHFHYDACFLMQTENSDEFTVSDESNQLKWFDTWELQKIELEERLARMLTKVFSS